MSRIYKVLLKPEKYFKGHLFKDNIPEYEMMPPNINRYRYTEQN